jgi:phage recombination protein Bet
MSTPLMDDVPAQPGPAVADAPASSPLLPGPGGPLAVRRIRRPAPRPAQDLLSVDDLALLKEVINQDLSDAELRFFGQVCRRLNLDPFKGQVVAIKRNDRHLGRKKLVIQTTIAAFRAIAQRSGNYVGREGPYWCGTNKKFTPVWLDSKRPAAARCGVVSIAPDGQRAVSWATVSWAEFAPASEDSNTAGLWFSKPAHMLGKCAEAAVLRVVWPEELGLLVIEEEMDQAGPRLAAISAADLPARYLLSTNLSPGEMEEDPAEGGEDAGGTGGGGPTGGPTGSTGKATTTKDQQDAELERLYALQPAGPKRWSDAMWIAKRRDLSYEVLVTQMRALLDALKIDWQPPPAASKDAAGEQTEAPDPGPGDPNYVDPDVVDRALREQEAAAAAAAGGAGPC